jgi:hypothetical protein
MRWWQILQGLLCDEPTSRKRADFNRDLYLNTRTTLNQHLLQSSDYAKGSEPEPLICLCTVQS